MLKRIISGVVIIGILVLTLVFMKTPVLTVFISLVSAIGVYELNNIFKVKKPAMVLSIAMAAVIPFWLSLWDLSLFGEVAGFYIIAMLIMMVKWHGELKFEQIAVSIISSLAIPCSLSCWIRFAEAEFFESAAYYYILLAVSCAWLSDVFAYFCGVAFGKHKMTPVVSPKKTWEGAIGGIVITAGVNVAFHLIFTSKFLGDGKLLWDWYYVVPISISLSIISIFGDLSASVIKRQIGVKDYGNLIPGHGGIMDRFDSMLFVFPSLYAIYTVAGLLNG
ncbi:MAG: phosphatidate cytidylyltransferase [Clostridia bacterium]|nr:phosphatidate cytidylyltransferase [Clostridia bacterium]